MPRDLTSARYAELRELIKQARKKAKMTQVDVADALGRPQSYVADIERGQRRVDVIEFLALAEAIGLNPIRMLEKIKDIKAG